MRSRKIGLAMGVLCLLASGCQLGFEEVPLAAPDSATSTTADVTTTPDTRPGPDSDQTSPPPDSVGTDVAPDHALPAGPTVFATPSDGAMDVLVSSTVELVFSEPMDIASVEAAFCLQGPDLSCAAGAFTWDRDQRTVFQPTDPLSPGATYDTIIRATAIGLSGVTLNGAGGQACQAPAHCVRFTTSDAVSPTLTIAPADGANGIVITRKIKLTFSEPMNTETVSNTFSLTGGGAPIATDMSVDTGDMVFHFTPTATLAYSTAYVATLADGAQSAEGTLFVGTGGTDCDAPAQCVGFVTEGCPQVEVCSTCGTGNCVDELVSQDAGCGCASSVPAPNCNTGVTYDVDCGGGYSCHYKRVEETRTCNCHMECQ